MLIKFLSIVWLNRLGILLQFFSFWLLAPHLLGEKHLRSILRLLQVCKKTTALIIGIAMFAGGFTLVIMIYLLTMTAMGINPKDIDETSTGHNIVLSIAVIGPLFLAIWLYDEIDIRIMEYFNTITSEKEIRQNYLKYGCILFILGTFFQFIAVK